MHGMRDSFLIACWLVIVIMALASATFWICNHCSAVCSKIVVSAAITLWISIVVFIVYRYGRDWACTNILRFLLSTIAGLYLAFKFLL